jgi:hypothetical protein
MDATLLQWRARLKFGKQQFWKSAPQSHRVHIAKKSRDASMVFQSKEQAHEIFWKCWGPNRGEILYKKLAEEYNVSFQGIVNLVRGQYNGLHIWCPVDEQALEQMKEDWKQKYSTYKLYAVSPGYDQLNNYDRLFLEDAPSNATLSKRLTTPSLVFHCRFNLDNPTPHSIRDYCDSIGIPRDYNDLRQYNAILKQYFLFLRNESSKTYEFSDYEELGNFLSNHKDNLDQLKYSRPRAHETLHKRILWRAKSFQGWMFYIKNEEI